jgi:putative ABC transport system substrate-binding protein
MNRRQFVFGLTLAAFRVPLAEAQALGKVFRVGFLATTAPIAELVSDPTNPFNSGFRREMRDRGYVEGQNFILELRCVEGKIERASEAVAELVRPNVDVIVTQSPEMTRRAQRVTTTVPIVTFVRAPVEEGLVVSLARPGGNITGLSNDTGPDLQGKLLELLQEGVPTLRRVAYLGSRAEWDGPGGTSAAPQRRRGDWRCSWQSPAPTTTRAPSISLPGSVPTRSSSRRPRLTITTDVSSPSLRRGTGCRAWAPTGSSSRPEA